MTPQSIWPRPLVFEFASNDAYRGVHHQNRSAGVVRKDRSYADVFGIDDRQRPGGLFFKQFPLCERH